MNAPPGLSGTRSERGNPYTGGMTSLDPAAISLLTGRTASASRSGGAPVGLTIFGCTPDEEVVFTDLAPRFGITTTITAEPISRDTLDLASGNRCISVSHKTRVDDALLRALSKVGVRHITTRSIGDDHIDRQYAETVGITVENVSYSPDGVADYTIMLILMAVREAKALIRRTDAHDYRLQEVRTPELRDRTVGVVGTGRIGAAVIDRLQGFGCRILAHDARPTAAIEHVSLDELLELSDIVTLHTPLTADTHRLIDASRLGQMKRGAYIINTARGPLIDTDALLAALESGRLGGAALDVVEGEEGIFYADHRESSIADTALARLQRLPNVVISPHSAFFTERALSDTVENTLVNCLRFLDREPTEGGGADV